LCVCCYSAGSTCRFAGLALKYRLNTDFIHGDTRRGARRRAQRRLGQRRARRQAAAHRGSLDPPDSQSTQSRRICAPALPACTLAHLGYVCCYDTQEIARSPWVLYSAWTEVTPRSGVARPAHKHRINIAGSEAGCRHPSSVADQCNLCKCGGSGGDNGDGGEGCGGGEAAAAAAAMAALTTRRWWRRRGRSRWASTARCWA
jgi:hypothetical protein